MKVNDKRLELFCLTDLLSAHLSLFKLLFCVHKMHSSTGMFCFFLLLYFTVI